VTALKYFPLAIHTVFCALTDFVAVQFIGQTLQSILGSHEVTDLENKMVSTQEDLEEAARQWEEQQRTQCDEKQIAQTDTNKGCRQKTPRQ
jgi:hypothetical protein